MKKCNKCGVEKEDNEFRKWSAQCKDCYKIYTKRYRQEHKEHNHDYYEQNKQKYIDRAAVWKKHHKEEVNEGAREYYHTHKEKYKENKKNWRENNYEKYRASENKYKNERYKSDPLYQLECKVRARLNKAILRNGFPKNSSTASMLGCSYEELLNFLGEKSTSDAHIDHIVPLAQAQNETELIKLSHYWNLQWLPATDNLAKQDFQTPQATELCNALLNRDWT